MNVSAWWLLGAFLVGGYAGALLVALMTVANSDGGNGATLESGSGASAEPAAPR
jgi:hypothetical protein